jgi:hypothetical protein
MTERIINRNPYLYGPGPVKRIPSSPFFSYFGRLPPMAGFAQAATFGVGVALAGSFGYKWILGDPQIRAIEEYYRQNPPR